MSTISKALAPSMSSAATYKAWISGIATALTSLGITRTGNSGDTNDPTGSADFTGASALTLPASTFNATGTYFEIRTFTDALQSGGGSNPVFIKLEYSCAATTTNYALRITIGGGTNTSGTLTGYTSSSLILQPTGTISSTTSYNCYFSSDGARMQMLLFAGLTNAPSMYSVSRTVNSSGSPTNEGVNICAVFNATPSQQFVPISSNTGGVNPTTAATAFTTAMPPSGFGTYGANWGVYPIYPNQGYSGYPDIGFLTFFNSDYGGPDQSMLTVTIYGTSHVYVQTSAISKPNSANGGSNAMNVFMRYD